MKKRLFLKIFKPHRLKIVEQVIVVTLFSIIIPLIVTGIIVNNINRQSLARELGKTAQSLAETVDENIYDLYESENTKIKDIASFIKFLPNEKTINEYLNYTVENSNIFSSLRIEKINSEKTPIYIKNTPYLNPETKEISVAEYLGKNKYLVGTMKKAYINKQVFKNINDKKREIFVLSEDGKLLFSLNYKEEDLKMIQSIIPKHIISGISIYIGDKENQPIVYRKMQWSGINIIVNTTEEIIENTIYSSAWKILIAMLVSSI
ncbi:hypothetical protein IJG14_07935, partial [bacterium]|nr:hypothetical protein [bacterium]